MLVVRPIRLRSFGHISHGLISLLFLAVIYGNDFLPRSLAQKSSFTVQLYADEGVGLPYLFVMPHELSIEHPLVESPTMAPAVWFSFLAGINFIHGVGQSALACAFGAFGWRP